MHLSDEVMPLGEWHRRQDRKGEGSTQPDHLPAWARKFKARTTMGLNVRREKNPLQLPTGVESYQLFTELVAAA
jgi:hypothetical protein